MLSTSVALKHPKQQSMLVIPNQDSLIGNNDVNLIQITTEEEALESNLLPLHEEYGVYGEAATDV